MIYATPKASRKAAMTQSSSIIQNTKGLKAQPALGRLIMHFTNLPLAENKQYYLAIIIASGYYYTTLFLPTLVCDTPRIYQLHE